MTANGGPAGGAWNPSPVVAAGSAREVLTGGSSEGLGAVRTFDGFAAVSKAACAVEEGETAV
jgi:hypothetical protein